MSRLPARRTLWASCLWLACFVETVFAAGGSQTAIRESHVIDEVPSVYFSHEFKHPVRVLDYFPLHVGTSWTYRHTHKDLMGPQQALITVQWIEEIQISAHRELPEGTLVLRKTSIRDLTCQAPEAARPEDIEWCREKPLRLTKTHYLIQGNYVYTVSKYDMDFERFQWLHNGLSGTPNRDKEKLPTFFFPLEKVEAYAERSFELGFIEQARQFRKGLGHAPDPGNYFWHTMGLEDVFVPYGQVKDGEVWLVGANIAEYSYSHALNHVPKRRRKLLMHRREIAKFASLAYEKGHTLVPLKVYFKEGRAKVLMGICKGKQTHDKRETLKKREAQRDIDRAMRKR